MMTDQIKLDPDLSIFDSRRLFSSRGIWAFTFVGLAIVVTAMSALWGSSGFLVDEWSWNRILVVIVAALYGLILGWMIFPRTVDIGDL